MYTKRITLNTRGEKWKVKKQVDNCRWFLFLLQYCCDPWRSFFHQCVAQKLLDKDPPNSDSLFSFFFFYLLLFFLGFTPVLVHWWRVFFLFLIESYSERICLYKIPALGFGPPSPWASASTLCWSKCSVIQTEGRLEGFVCAYVCWILPVDESLLYVFPPLSLSGLCLLFCLIAFWVNPPGLLLSVFYSSRAHLIRSPRRHSNIGWGESRRHSTLFRPALLNGVILCTEGR